MTQAPVPPGPDQSVHSQTMSAMTRVHNPSTYEIVVDSEGHILPGRATTSVRADDAVTARLMEAQRLTTLPETTPPPVWAPVEDPNPKSRKKSAPAAPAVAEDGE